MEDIKAASEGDIFTLATSLGQKAAQVAKALKPEPKAQQAPERAAIKQDITPDIHMSPSPRRR